MPLDPDKVFMFPDSYNRLREELYKHWPELWKTVQWSMAFDAEMFIEAMNAALDIRLDLSATSFEATCDGWCSRYLKELRRKRGEANP